MASGSKPAESAEVIFLHGVRYERDPMSAMFEDLPNEELMMLAENIKAEGQKLPITVNTANGLVLDGWQRLRACQLIEAEPKVVETEIPNPAAYVMAVNEHRRGSASTTVTQRAIQAMELDDIDRDRGETPRRASSAAKLAEAAGCSTTTVEQIRMAIKWDKAHGTDYLERMKRGRISAVRASDEIREAKWRQRNPEPPQPGETSVASDTLRPPIPGPTQTDDEPAPGAEWKAMLRDRLIEMSASGFEHFAGALLRATGSTQVDVTGGSGDGGIDGIAIQSGLVPVRIAFQCKRYQGSVGAPEVRDFRGSFVGRCDRGLIITTGTFTRSAKEEASRPGANPVDLIDGEALCNLLKEHKLGVDVTERIVEDVTVDDAYFDQFEQD